MSMKSLGSETAMGLKKLECAQHGTYMANVVVVGDREYPARCPSCVADETNAQKNIQRSRAVRALISRAEIPLRYRDRSFANYRAAAGAQGTVAKFCRSYAENFEQRMRQGSGLILCGRPGTGKTHLACAIASVVLASGRSVWYTTVSAAIRSVKQTFDRNAQMSERDALAAFYAPHLLILDEVGMQRGTEFELALLGEVMNERYARVLPTIVATNLTHIELAKYIGERAIDRMREGDGAVLALEWESYRPMVAGDEQLGWPDLVPVNFSEITR